MYHACLIHNVLNRINGENQLIYCIEYKSLEPPGRCLPPTSSSESHFPPCLLHRPHLSSLMNVTRNSLTNSNKTQIINSCQLFQVTEACEQTSVGVESKSRPSPPTGRQWYFTVTYLPRRKCSRNDLSLTMLFQLHFIHYTTTSNSRQIRVKK